MSLGCATHHPEGMADNSPTFQRWEPTVNGVQVPKGRLTVHASAVPSGLLRLDAMIPTLKPHWLTLHPSPTLHTPKKQTEEDEAAEVDAKRIAQLVRPAIINDGVDRHIIPGKQVGKR